MLLFMMMFEAEVDADVDDEDRGVSMDAPPHFLIRTSFSRNK